MTGKELYGAIEAGGTKFVCAAGYFPNSLIAKETFLTTTPEETFARAVAFFRNVSRDYQPVAKIGVASFGPVDIDPASLTYGAILKTPKPGWSGASLPELLAPLGVPLIVNTDVNGAALGEVAFGAGRGLRVLAYVTVGTGIGVGVVKDGKPVSREHEAIDIKSIVLVDGGSADCNATSYLDTALNDGANPAASNSLMAEAPGRSIGVKT